MSRIQLASLTLCTAFAFGLLHVGPTQAAIKTQVIEYKQGDIILEGYLAYDDAVRGKRPGILVVHEWTGLGDFVRKRTEALAKLGYVAFAADIYGKGIRLAGPPASAQEMAKYMNNRPLFRARVRAGLDILKRQALVDTAKLAAIGYCFGGAAVLELARSGADVLGIISFHGDLTTPTPEDAKNIKARVLALHGADDPIVPPKDVAAFEKEMRDAKVDWQLVVYGGALHAFTNPGVNAPAQGAAYNEKADKRSWVAMQAFFTEIFEKR